MTLTSFEFDPLLDLAPWVGQRQATYRFALSNAVTGEQLGDITPIRGASLSHDTTRTIKRQLTIALGSEDTMILTSDHSLLVAARINVFMVFPDGTEYPLGRFMFTDTSRSVFTSGRLGNFVLNDEMFLVDQQITTGINGRGSGVNVVILKTVNDLPINLKMDASPFASVESWGIGTGRGQILESLSVTGDFFSPWFDNNGDLRFIRTFEPATAICDFDFNAGNKVIRQPIVETDDLLTAPNKFIVVSNAQDNLSSSQVSGIYDVPPNAPHSFAKRGFTIAQVLDLQLGDNFQASAVATNVGIRQTIFERVTLTTAPDPRHDSYNVIRWQDANWLELGWSLTLQEGSAMNHVLRKSYSP
jgi:hypothetical protein